MFDYTGQSHWKFLCDSNRTVIFFRLFGTMAKKSVLGNFIFSYFDLTGQPIFSVSSRYSKTYFTCRYCYFHISYFIFPRDDQRSTLEPSTFVPCADKRESAPLALTNVPLHTNYDQYL